MTLNKCLLIGNVGADPVGTFFPNGDPKVTISLATTESWRDRGTGEKKEITEWHRVIFYRGLADVVTKYLKKGSRIYLEGRLRTRKWQDKDGQERTTTEIEATEMKIL